MSAKSILGYLTILGALTVSFGCAGPSPTQSAVKKFHDVGIVDKSIFSISGLRHAALRDSALSLGARAGLAWRSKQINQIVAQHEIVLDRIYNFHRLMLDHNVLPPILIEARNTLDQTSDSSLRIADRTYSILEQARFVTMPPTWRDYVLLQYQEPEKPDRSMLPRTDAEKAVWDRYLDEGWQAGILQGDSIFKESLGRLKRDYEGMIRYRTLLAQNMVSPPYVAELNMGITGGENELAVNDRVLRITALPGFNTRGEKWVTEITPIIK